MNYRFATATFFLFLCIFSYLMVISPYAQETQQTEKIICTNCNTDNPAENKFCYQCGTVLLKHNHKDKNQDAGGETIRDKTPEKQNAAETEATDPVSEIKVKAIYDFGVMLFNEKDYAEALVQFYRIIHDFPGSHYYDGACVMREACRRMLIFKNDIKRSNVIARPTSFNKDYQKGCLGFLGIVGAILLLGAIAG